MADLEQIGAQRIGRPGAENGLLLDGGRVAGIQVPKSGEFNPDDEARLVSGEYSALPPAVGSRIGSEHEDFRVINLYPGSGPGDEPGDTCLVRHRKKAGVGCSRERVRSIEHAADGNARQQSRKSADVIQIRM
jgi:hypothetical protein